MSLAEGKILTWKLVDQVFMNKLQRDRPECFHQAQSRGQQYL
jgi:hypothetical protein